MLYNDKGLNPVRGYSCGKIYEPNVGAPEYIKGEMDNKIIGGDLNMSLKSMETLSRHKIRKETVVLSDTLDQIYTEHSIPNQQNIHSFQEHMEQLPGQVTL